LPAGPQAFVLPGGLAIPAGALLLCVVFLASTTWRNLLAGGAALLVGALIYAFGRRSPRPGVPSAGDAGN
jgi:uncharacterized membrane protein HdeD (DUF308 family)